MNLYFDLNTASPEEYLEYLQQEYSPLEYKAPTLDDVNKLFKNSKFVEGALESLYYNLDKDERLKKIKDLCVEYLSKEVPSKLQDPIIFSLIDNLSKEISAVANKMNLHLSEKVAIGSLPIQQFNALVIKVPAGGIVIVLNRGIIMFLYYMAKIFSSFIPLGNSKNGLLNFRMEEDLLQKEFERNQEGHTRFGQLILLYKFFGRTEISPYWQTEPQLNLASILTDVSELFVIAHEYSHIFLKHLIKSQTKKRVLDDKLEVEEIITNWNQELDADNLGCVLTLMCGNYKRRDFTLSYLGIYFFFLCAEILEKIHCMYSSSTHPSASIRKEYLNKWFKQNYPEKSDAIMYIMESMQNLFNKLWEKNIALVNKFLGELSE